MATNKNAQLRYKALDECFANRYKKFFMDDLMAHCAQILSDHYAKSLSVSRRQIFDDIDFMKSDAGYQAPIESYKDGRKAYYRYAEYDFSILKKPLNPTELNTLNEALATLNRLNALPGFDWVNSLQTKLKSGLAINQQQPIIGFEENEFLQGLAFLNDLYQYIAQQQCINITYKSFKAELEHQLSISPYYLKQYNNRWFLFGWNHALQQLQNLALDRMLAIAPAAPQYIGHDIDFKDYFEDIVGVSHYAEAEVVAVKIKLSSQIKPYVQSKPLHGSQKIIGDVLMLSLKPNYELEALILSYGPNMAVLEPLALRESLKAKIEQMKNLY
jgi:predicted DNA-binding transcriptional regulator YafY